MKIRLRYCPTCKRETIQAKRTDNFGDSSRVVWYCPNCGKYNEDKGKKKLIENVATIGYIT